MTAPMTQTSCPEPAAWRALLDGTLSPDETGELSAHLEQCQTCCQRLETLSGLSEENSGLLRRLSDTRPAPEPGLHRIIARLKEEGSKVESETGTEQSDEIPLDFLDPPEQPGQLGRLGHYDVLELIGRGGMGIVLKAFDQSLQRVVAIKVMSPYLASSPSARKRFVREARATAAIRNEHVIGIHAVAEAKGLPYFVMEYIAGVSLQERLNQSGPLELKEVLRIGMQTARGLAAAHAQGLIHRDVKPANILLENGVERVKLTDFGLARAVDDATLTQSGVVAGTPQYMSPEQARGEPVDQRSDLFSLGSVLYALCTGRPPFRAGSTVAVLKRISDEPASDLRSADPGIPVWLVEIIERLHAKDPAERFQSAGEVAELLAQHLADLQTGAPSAMGDLRSPTRKQGNQYPLLARRAPIVLVLLALLGIGTLYAPTIYRLATNQGELIIETDDPDVEVIIKQDDQTAKIIDKKTGRTVNLKAGKYEIELGDSDKNLTLSTNQFTLKRGGKEIVKVSVGKPEIKEVLRFEEVTAIPWAAAFCLGDRCVVGGAGTISKDGKWSLGDDTDLRVWDAKTGKVLRRLKGHTNAALCVAVSPNGKLAVSGSQEKEIGENCPVRVWDLESGKELRQFTKHGGRVMAAAFLPNGRQVVTVGNHTQAGESIEAEVRLWDVETCEEIRQFKGHDHEVKSVAVSPDGKRMLTGGQDNRTILWDLETGTILRQTDRATAKSESGQHVAIARDSGLAALACWDCTILVFDLESGKPIRRFTGHKDWAGSVLISPDGRRVLSCGDTSVRLWDVQTGLELCRLDYQGGPKAISADGKEMLLETWDPSLRLLRLPPTPKNKPE